MRYTKQLPPGQERSMSEAKLMDTAALEIRPTRIVRIELTKEQIKLLIDYAMRDGFQRKNPSYSWDMGEENLAAKYAIMSRLGFDH